MTELLPPYVSTEYTLWISDTAAVVLIDTGSPTRQEMRSSSVAYSSECFCALWQCQLVLGIVERQRHVSVSTLADLLTELALDSNQSDDVASNFDVETCGLEVWKQGTKIPNNYGGT